MAEKILEVKNLVTRFSGEKSIVTAVDSISFDVYKGKTLGLVGESGSGKSATALSIMRLISPPGGSIDGGEIRLHGDNILQLSDSSMRKVRGNKISMIFQEPMTSLNPVYTVGNQIMETIILHQKVANKVAKKRCIDLLNLVGVPASEQRINDYPHQLSGGMRQRVMIAMALACDPDVLIADEPTTALDVTTQAQILELMTKLQSDTNMGIIMITHDLGVVAEVCDEVAVMYCGRIIEQAPVKTLFTNPAHHYTKGLLEAMLPLSGSRANTGRNRLPTIEGMVPPLTNLPQGCNFQDRCARADAACKGEQGDPIQQEIASAHFVECFHPLQGSS